MSELPKAPKRSKSKSLGTDGDIATPEHERLVTTLWNHLDEIVQTYFVLRDPLINKELQRLTGQEREKAEEYARKLGVAIDQGYYKPSFTVLYGNVPSTSEVTIEADELGILIAAKARLETYAATFKLDFDPGKQETIVRKRTFQKTITNEKGVTTGFVDMEADVLHPDGLEITLGDRQEESEVPVAKSSWELREAVKFRSRGAPEVQCKCQSTRIWFDVRTELPTTSVLVREFKTLREHTRMMNLDTICVLVAPDIPSDVCRIMVHEGFGCINLAPWLDQAPAS